MELFELVAGGVSLLFVGAITLPRYLRTRRALNEAIDNTVCVACQSTSVTEVASDCFRCDACRFQWGDGWAAEAARERGRQLAGMTEERRKEIALEELRNADARLQAAEVQLEHAAKQVVKDMLISDGPGLTHGGDVYSRARNEAMVSAAQEMGLAQKHMRHAAEAVGSAASAASGQAIEMRASTLGLDAYVDLVFTDFIAHNQAKKMLEQAGAMRQAVAAAVGRVETGSGRAFH